MSVPVIQNARVGWLRSIRLRLTLWNVGVVTLLLAGLGLTLHFALQATLIGSIDRGLTHFGAEVQTRIQSPSNAPPHFPVFNLGPDGLKLAPPNPRQPLWPPPHDPGPNGNLRMQILDRRGQNVLPTTLEAAYDTAAFRHALTGQSNFSRIIVNHQPVRILSIPVRRNGNIVGVAQIPRPLTETYQEVRRLTNILLLLAAPAVLLAGLGGAFLTSRALRPVREITHAAERIEAEDLSRRLTVAGRDELSELAATFNGMLQRLEDAFTEREAAYSRLEEANRQLERVNEQQRRFTADASHELKTPLTVIEGTVSLSLSAERSADQYRESLETVSRSTHIMTRIVEDLLLLARSDAGQLGLDRRPVSVHDVLALARDAISVRKYPPIHLREIEPPLSVYGDPAHLTRLFVNLLDNAARHTPSEQPIEISATASAKFVTIVIADKGTGIAPEHLPHIFERFYRVDAARARRHGGTGLGLAICQSIVDAHDGTLEIESVLGEGTCVRITLPRLTLTTASPLSIGVVEKS